MDFSLSQKPQINLACSTRDRMWLVAACAFLAVLQSSLDDSFLSLRVALAALGGTLLTELLFNLRDRRFTLKDGSAAASALVLALFLPNQINPLFAFCGGVFAMAVVKHSFGGLGSNWVNPAASGWLFIRFTWPDAFNRCLENSHLVRLAAALESGLRNSQGSPLGMLKINGWQGGDVDTLLDSFLNNTVFSFTGVTLPGGYLSFFAYPGPGIIADRGLLFLILGTITLAAFRTFRLWLPLLFLCFYSFLVRIFGALPFGGTLGNGDMLFGIFSGGIIAAAFMLIAEPATGPKSSPGQAIYIFLAACFAFLFRFPGHEPYGAAAAVLLGNSLVPLIRRGENKFFYEKRRQP
ncbi:MAG: RnfABCDGE type electron transport complex subunit D [Treponema sp.]|nr:RnfABCDGE type electron transport complex subunit D [Treponema sp.]